MSVWVVVRCDHVESTGLLCASQFRTKEETVKAAVGVVRTYGWTADADGYLCPTHALAVRSE